jgi:hypothetical protein
MHRDELQARLSHLPLVERHLLNAEEPVLVPDDVIVDHQARILEDTGENALGVWSSAPSPLDEDGTSSRFCL